MTSSNTRTITKSRKTLTSKKDKKLKKNSYKLRVNSLTTTDLKILGINPDFFNGLSYDDKVEFLYKQALDEIIILKGRKERKQAEIGKNYKTSFRQILSYLLVPYKWMFTLTLILSIIQSLLFLSLPILFEKAVRDLIENRDILMIIYDFLITLGILALLALTMYWRIYINNWMGNNIIKSLRDDLFKNIQDASFRFLDKNQTGDLISRTTSDINLLKVLLSSQIAMFFRQSFTVVFAIVIMFVINPYVALFANIPIPILFIIMIYYRRKIFPIFATSRATYGELTSVVQENVMGMRVIRAFAQEAREIKKFEEKNSTYFDQNQKLVSYQASFDPMVRVLANVCITLILVFGTVLTDIESISISELFALIMLSSFSIEPLFFLSRFLTDMSKIGATCDRIVMILNNDLREGDEHLPDFPKIRGEVEFDGVFVSYEGNEHYELNNISFKTVPGEQIAILGSTGSGKSTLIRVISRFYPTSKGTIRIDGKNIKNYNKKSLRRQIGVVPQETLLLGRTIYENLTLGRPEATFEEVERACTLAKIDGFIETLPKKYNTMVGERGVTLSGGQKQRIAIARALIIKPKILLLDDSTSNVDVDTEFEIQRAFSDMFKGTSTFIITQRLSTVRHVDRIIVLNHGKIAEIGTHEELLLKNGIYHQLYHTLKVDERSNRGVK
jgi:ABC-type multidrug transport system fused ATPase/permease subunit